MCRRIALALVLTAAARSDSAALASPAGLAVEGTEFVLHLENGQTLRSAQLVGAELDLGDGGTIRIEGVRADPGDPSGETVLHTLAVNLGDGNWQNPCDPDAEGHREGFPVPGHWDAAGRFHSEPGFFALTCTSGAQGKCVRFGYKPWRSASDGTSLAAIYEACIHMVRADYCGDGNATTKDGTEIDLFDHQGVQRPESGPEFHFEAGWAPSGAVCVARTRIPQNLTLERLGQNCLRLQAALGTDCTEERATALGAVLFNRSR
jgi:ADYC domain